MSSYAGDSVAPSSAGSELLTGPVYGGKGSKKQRKALAAHTKKVKKAYEKFVKLAKKAKKLGGGVLSDKEQGILKARGEINDIIIKRNNDPASLTPEEQQKLADFESGQEYTPPVESASVEQPTPNAPQATGGRRSKGMFKKGSKAARDFMAMLRARRGKSRRGSRRY